MPWQHFSQGQKSLWFVAMGLILMAEETGGERVPLFWFRVLHPAAEQQLWALRVMALGCPQLSPNSDMPPRGRWAAQGAVEGIRGWRSLLTGRGCSALVLALAGDHLLIII